MSLSGCVYELASDGEAVESGGLLLSFKQN